MPKTNSKIIGILLLGLAPSFLMVYGWYLGQLHQSGYDVAGIFLFVTGVIGLILAFILHLLTRNYPWHNAWFASILTSLLGCGIVFGLLLLLSRLHG